MPPLFACTACARHVRASEASCPFCGASLALAARTERLPPATRLGRSALYAFGIGALSVATASVVAACTHTEATIYGGPPPDLQQHPLDAGLDAPRATPTVAAPAYGGPPPMRPMDAASPPKAH